jgi:hypothetical protein
MELKRSEIKGVKIEMTKHAGKRLFITGIPTSGKSYLAKKLANDFGGVMVLLDDHREKVATDDKYRDFVNFYINKDELDYYTHTTPENRWQDLVNQSEGLWPAYVEEINKFKDEKRLVIFESVNLLPHLIKNTFEFPAVVLIGKTYEETLKRNIAEPRWGNTRELQELEADAFFYAERPKYVQEAEKCGYPVYESADEAYVEVKKILNLE